MVRERILLSLFGKKLLSFKKLDTGEVIGTGLLNPIFDKLRFLIMMAFQANFYRQYKNLGRWRGKRVANTFAPPVGSSPMLRVLKASIMSRIFRHTFPVAMTFAVTYKCQCTCKHCSAGRHLRHDLRELSTKEAKALIDQSQNLGVSLIAFTGGEPLLRDDIYELISYVDKRKALPILFTNGLLLTEENIDKLVKAGLYSLFISIDSPIPEEHNKLRGLAGLFESAIQGIKRMQSKEGFVGISSYATRSATQKGMYKKMYLLARELGVQNLIYFDGVPTGNMLKDVSEMLTPAQHEEIRKFSSNVFRRRKVPQFNSQSWQNSIEGYLGGIGCLAVNLQYYVSAYGDVSPCDFTPLSFGNVRSKSLKEIWKKMIHHPAYKYKDTSCRMQNPKFRQIYIDPIPDDSKLPYDIEKLPFLDYRI
ncbi:MAG: radical SAM/SPASM domain-containing protein [Candidatus Odinarchaeota archaeon]